MKSTIAIQMRSMDPKWNIYFNILQTTFKILYFSYTYLIRLIGFFDFQKPTYMVCDAELMNQIGVTKFDHFNDLGTVIGIELGVLYGRSLAFLSGNEWRAMRSTLTPAFTRHKLRHMFEYMNDAARKLVQNLIKKSQEGSGRIHCKIAQLFACYAADITASCFFGLKIDSFENPTNEFIKNAKDGLDFSGIQSGLRVLLLALFPKLMHAIDFDIVPKRVKTYFKSIVLDVMDQRTERQIFRPDMINTLMKIRNKRLKCQNQTKVSDGDHHWTDDELVAQLFISCISSFDAISNIPAFMAYELALNQNVQQKLYDEIQIVNKSLGKQPFTFDALLKLKFLDQVIDETLRKYPAAPFIIRKCTKDVELVLGDSKTVKIERGMNLWIPISSIQCDPENFENPNKFDPERFNEENKRKIRTGSYIPFWIGPRNCIGKFN